MKSIVVLGHKDHGKSTFLGRLLYETNSVPVDKVATVKKIDAEAGREFEWAHLLDSFKEEREQEMTYDTASVFVQGKKDTYVFIDVPGHSELVHQMLSGASKANRAILMVSAKEGVDVMSVKHLALAGFLGIKNLTVCINKMDAVGYDKSEFDEMKQAVEAEIKRTRFSSERVLFVPISAREGDNVVSKSSKMPWYDGPAVFAHVESGAQSGIGENPFRGLIQDVYEYDGKSMAMIVVKDGIITQGDRVKVMPQGIFFSADELISSSGKAIPFAGANENIGIFLKPEWNLGRGTVLSPEHDAPVLAASISAEVFLFKKIEAGESVSVECGGMRSGVAGLLSLAQEEILPVTIKFETPLLFDASETFLNKFVVKQKGDVIGAGRVISV